MKCPKCGFNSFECLSVCKKCSQDLTAFKVSHGLKPIVLQMETRTAMVAAMTAEAAQSAVAQQPAEQPNDMFSFDIPEEVNENPEEKVKSSDDFFNFSEKPAAGPNEGFGDFSFDDDQDVKKPATMDDAFSSLLESTPLGISGTVAQPPETTAPAPDRSPDEFELDSFSWDETPGTSSNSEKKPVDDFDSLFGEISAGAKK